MATIRTNREAGVLARLLTEASVDVEQTDGELVRAFVERKNPAAFRELVQRHGSMVLGVCLCVLRHRQDAEDAFQATFLVLAQKAASISPRNAVGNWLHGVALQTAFRARAITMKRRRRESVVPSVPEPATREGGWDDLADVLDEELRRLPSHYRAVLLLCDVEGRTRADAARHLGCPEGSVSSRLSRARAKLAMRLTKRGVTLPTGTVALLVGQNATAAGVPAPLLTSTVEAVGSLAAGSVLGGGVSPAVTTLTEGVLKAMFIKKITTATIVVLVLSVAAITGGRLAIGQSEGTGKPMDGKEVKPPAAEKPVEPAAKQDKEAFTAWGKEVGGLQAGIGFPLGQKRVYRHGETVTLVVRVRNVGKEEVEFQYIPRYFIEKPPTVTDGKGEAVSLVFNPEMGFKIEVNVNLAPGKEIELGELKLELGSLEPGPGNKIVIGEHKYPTLYGTGKFQIQYKKVLASVSSGSINLDPALGRLATGNLELEVQEPEELPPEKEGFTAWGKEVGGLQLGLGFHAGEKRTYSHGETVKLIVRLRNVGKGEVTFRDEIVWMLTNPLSVTDRDGKAVYVACLQPVMSNGLLRGNDKLPPGKEVEYDNLEVLLKPANAKDDPQSHMTLFGTGKFQIRYRADGVSTTGRITNSSGNLQLEVTEARVEKQKVLTPAEAIKVAGDSKLTTEFNKNKPAVEFNVQFVAKAILVKTDAKKDADWAHGHSPDDVCLGTLVPSSPMKAEGLLRRNHTRFVATLTAKAITQLNKAGINDMEKHFKGKTVRVTGLISRRDYRGYGTPPEVEIVIDDLSQIEVMK